jgi:hypothetical protein
MDKRMRAVRDTRSLARHVKRVARNVRAAKGRYGFLGPLVRYHATLTSALNGNWWHLGLAGALDPYLCPRDCVGRQDYVGLDYYWGVDAWWRVARIARLIGALVQGQYGKAPVWPAGLAQEIHYLSGLFQDPKPIMILENGCVEHADGYSRERYLRVHVDQVLKARAKGAAVAAYICWSITTNREWGAPVNEQSDFGLFHVDLDGDPFLRRTSTPSADAYKELISRHQSP